MIGPDEARARDLGLFRGLIYGTPVVLTFWAAVVALLLVVTR